MSAAGAGALRLVVMGPSGCGKTTLASALADALQYRFIEGDALHPAANVDKMRGGVPLEDADRWPWLDAVGAALAADATRGAVAACSALRRAYRDRLRAIAGPVLFILPVVPREVLGGRLAARLDHYMPASLLDSQLDTLEGFSAEDPGMRIDGTASLASQLESIRSRLDAAMPPSRPFV